MQRWLARGWWSRRLHPALREAYRIGNVEAIISFLDAIQLVKGYAVQSGFHAYLQARGQGLGLGIGFFNAIQRFYKKVDNERVIRDCLNDLLIDYFEWRDVQDRSRDHVNEWPLLHRFCSERLRPGDTIITFNYDCALERVLLQQGRFAVKYIDNQPNIDFLVPNILKPAAGDPAEEILLLKLHGSVGWRPYLRNPSVGISREHLQGLNANLDGALDLGNAELALNRTMILPTWYKTFEKDNLFSALWKQAFDAMASATECFVIGYSFPQADVASWALRLIPGRATWKHVIRPRGNEGAIEESFESWMNRPDTRT